jgi:hypothetical protein
MTFKSETQSLLRFFFHGLKLNSIVGLKFFVQTMGLNSFLCNHISMNTA